MTEMGKGGAPQVSHPAVSERPFATVREAEEAEARAEVAKEPAEEHPVHLSGDEASGGRSLGVMRYVLAISLLVIAAVFAALLTAYR